VKLRRWSSNTGQPIQIKKVSEQEAIELGANMFGEAIIFVVASVILVAEYARQKEKEAAKEKAGVDVLVNLQLQISELQNGLKEMNLLISSLQTPKEPAKTAEKEPAKVLSDSVIATPSAAPPAKAEEKTALSVTCVAPVSTALEESKDETNNIGKGVVMKAVSNLVRM